MNIDLKIPSPLQKIEDPRFVDQGITVYIKRDDLIHPIVSGNKWRKLRLNLEKFRQGKYEQLVTFGGAFSNHIAATAAIGKMMHVPTLGIIRGEELNVSSNETLKQASENGMQLRFVSREKYEERYERIYHEELRRELGNVLLVDEGGANYYGVMGISDVITEMPFEPDYIFCACGTGTTAAGLLAATEHTRVVAVAVLRNAEWLKDEISKLLLLTSFDEESTDEKMERLQLETGFDFGGYGKYTPELIDLMNTFYRDHRIELDQVYTAKMVAAFYHHLETGKIKKGSRVVMLHSGGVQGTTSIKSLLEYNR
jgi:1-aminocyclopropane-1-carboxylate deaminase